MHKEKNWNYAAFLAIISRYFELNLDIFGMWELAGLEQLNVSS